MSDKGRGDLIPWVMLSVSSTEKDGEMGQTAYYLNTQYLPMH